MTSLSEQLPTIRKSPWDAQLDLFDALGKRALNSTEQLIALNLKTSRASVEGAAGAVRQLLDARDPRDLFAVGAVAQRQWQQLFAYSSELLGIAGGARLQTWTLHPAGALAAPVVDLPSTPAQALEQAGIATAAATTVASEIGAAATETAGAVAAATLADATLADATLANDTLLDDTPQAAAGRPDAPQPDAAPVPAVTELEAETTGAAPSETPPQASEHKQEQEQKQEPQPGETPSAAAQAAGAPTVASAQAPQEDPVERAIADEAPTAKAKPLVEAMSHIAPKPAGAAHPLASTLPLQANGHVDLPIVTPVDSTPPLHAQARASRPARAARKK